MSELFESLLGDAGVRELVVAALDISIVYYLIYRVLLTIKGTRAAQMVIGLVLIGAGFFAAERFQMSTVSWLLDNFINYFIIIIIVVFQADIRRGLVRLGQNVFPFGRTREVTHALDEVIAAADHLAKGRIGGIFVFERDADLEDFLEHGEAIDARVSKELLVALFVPSRDNELHDGAVLVDKSLRIARAGSVLPLSRRPMSHEFGTRHRAAVGITEETDAVALVISEERGEISLCFSGNIARDLEPDALRSAVMALFYNARGEQSRVAEEAKAAAEITRAVAAIAEGGDGGGDDDRRASTAGGSESAARSKTAIPASAAEEPVV